MPCVSMPEASMLRHKFPDKSILDFGCAKGFLVRALRAQGVESYGYDISEYALANADPLVKPYCSDKLVKCDIIFSKDVLEHIPYIHFQDTLKQIYDNCDEAFIIIPFAKDGKYICPEYEKDITHIIKEDEWWWHRQFRDAGFMVWSFKHSHLSIKKKWTEKCPKGNGFFHLVKT